MAGATVVALAALGVAVPLPAVQVERWYSALLYPRIQRTVTPLVNQVPVAVLDVLLAGAALAVVVVVSTGLREAWGDRRVAPAARAVWCLLVSAAAVYLVFLAMWGLNYQRLPLSERLDMVPGPPAPGAVVNLGLEAVSRLNALHGEAHALGWSDPPSQSSSLRDGFAEVQTALGDPPSVPGRLKRSLLGPYFRWSGVDGMLNPFGLETLANSDLLPFERPFVAAHEWAHLAGYADEAEASFIGWLACVHGDAATEYSGWLALYLRVFPAADPQGQAALSAVLDDGPRADIAAIAERQQRTQVSAVRRAGWAVYDQYLRTNRVEGGVARYSAIVTLAAQARFADGWTPVRRTMPQLAGDDPAAGRPD